MSDQLSANMSNISPEEARKMQQTLRQKLQITPLQKPVQTIAGADISFNKYESTVYAGFVVLDLKNLMPIAHALAVTEVKFPYVPGLLSFREIPPLLEAWKLLENKPDVVMVDGHGIAHPRRLGIAAHFGLLTDIPTVGVAKKKLYGQYEEPATEAGSLSPLTQGNESLGYVYRTKNKVKPVFVSPGHKTNLDDALQLIRKTSGKYRIPEPTRQAHLLVNALRRGELPSGFKDYVGKSKNSSI